LKNLYWTSAILLFSCSQLFAHSTWLEKDNKKTYLYFGDFAKGKKEVKRKVLDKIKPNVEYKVLNDRLEILKVDQTEDIVTTVVMPPRKIRNSEKLIQTTFYSRLGRETTSKLLPLDLVSKKPNSNYFTLLYKDKPLQKTKVIVTAPSKWQKTFRTSKKGEVSIQTPYKGLYMIEVIHKEADKQYIYSLTFNVKNGLAWGYDPNCCKESK